MLTKPNLFRCVRSQWLRAVAFCLLLLSAPAAHAQIYVRDVIGLRAELDSMTRRSQGTVIVGTRGNSLTGGRVSLTDSGQSSRIGHIVPYSCTNLQLEYANIYNGTNGETPNTDDINVKAAIEYPLGNIYPVFFAGARTINLGGGAIVKSDPVGITVNANVKGSCTDAAATTTSFTTTLTGSNSAAYGGQILQFTSGANAGVQRYIGATGFNTTTGAVTVDVALATAPAKGDTFQIVPVVYSRTYGSVTGTKNLPLSLPSLGGGANSPFEGRTTGSDQTDSGTPTNSTQNVFSPSALLGMPTDDAIPSVAFCGDSIGLGTGDPDTSQPANGGFIVRALQSQFPFMNGCKGGEKLEDFQNLNGKTRYRRMYIATGCPYVVMNLGTNNMSTSTVAQMQAIVLEITAAWNVKGTKVFWCTLVPKTTSSTAWTTVAGQSVTANDGVRTAFNDWLRDGSGSGYVAQAGGKQNAGVFDVAKTVEVNSLGALATNGGFWLPGTQVDTGTATAGSTTTITDSGKSWTVNQFAGMYVYLTAGTGSGQAAGYIISNTATQLTIKSAWTTGADATSVYRIVVNAMTVEGTHPTANGHLLMSAAVDITQFQSVFWLLLSLLLTGGSTWRRARRLGTFSLEN